MSDELRQTDAGRASIGELREHAQKFAEHARGPLRLLRMRAGDVSIEVHWHEAGGSGGPAEARAAHLSGPVNGGANGAAAAGLAEPADGAGEDRALVTSPMVGTFYRAPSPGADPFVEVGDLVEPGQTVGIVEAMKLMNAIAAECQGLVTQILAEDAQPVEFGQPLVALAARS